jgi:hypothetical protein
MTQNQLRNVISVFLLLVHLAVPAMIFVVYLCDGFVREEMAKLLEIVVPMVAALSALAIAHIIRTKSKKKKTGDDGEPELSRLFVFAAVGFPTLFVTVITALVLLKAWNIGLKSFEDLKTSLVTVETLFGAYTGQLMASLFDKEKAQ